MRTVRHRSGRERGHLQPAGFTLPGDVSGSDKAYRQDIVDPPIRAVAGAIGCPGTARTQVRRQPSSSKRTPCEDPARRQSWGPSMGPAPISHQPYGLSARNRGARRWGVDLLGRLVRIESPSDDRAGLDRFADRLEELFGDLGSIGRIGPANAERGRHLRLPSSGTDAPVFRTLSRSPRRHRLVHRHARASRSVSMPKAWARRPGLFRHEGRHRRAVLRATGAARAWLAPTTAAQGSVHLPDESRQPDLSVVD